MKALLLSLALCGVMSAQQTYTITNSSVLQSSTIRTGVNFAQTAPYGVGQPFKNLFYKSNSSFEGYINSLMMACAAGTTTACYNYNIKDGGQAFFAYPANYFAGGTYTFQVAGASGVGPALGCSGTVTSHYAGNDGAFGMNASYVSGTGVITYTLVSGSWPADFTVGDPIAVDSFSSDTFGSSGTPLVNTTIATKSSTVITVNSVPGQGSIAPETNRGQMWRMPKWVLGTTCGGAIQNQDQMGVSVATKMPTINPGTGVGNIYWEGDLTLNSGAVATSETTDLPASTGKHALQLDCSANGSSSATVKMSTDETNGAIDSPGVLINGGAWTASVQVKVVSCTGTCGYTADISRSGGFAQSFSPLTVTPNATPNAGWQNYLVTFSPAETTSTAAGTINMFVNTVGQGVFIVKNFRFEQTTGTDTANITVFRDSVVHALQSLKPGTIRLWDGQTGDTFANFTDFPDGHQVASWHTGSPMQDHNPGVIAGDFLNLCEYVGADPWIVLPPMWSDTDIKNFIEYVAGSSGTTQGARRVAFQTAAGFPTTPWTSVFNKVYTELGNEDWNTRGFTGQNIPGSPAFGYLNKRMYSAAKTSSSYSSSNWTFELGCQQLQNPSTFGDCYANHQADTTGHDAITQSGYTWLVDGMTTTNTTTEWTAKVATTWGYSRDATNGNGIGLTNLIAGSGRVVPIDVYEEQDSQQGFAGTTTVNNAQMSNDVSAHGAGLAQVVGNQERYEVYGRPQNIWNLMQISDAACCSLGQIPIWGIAISYGGVNDRRRPVFVDQSTANQCMIGPEVSHTWTGRNTYNSAALNGYNALNGVPFAHVYTYHSGSNSCILAINVDPTNAQVITWAGDVPTGSMTQTLVSAAENATNESSVNVSAAVSTVTAASTYSICAHCLVTLAFTTAATPTIASVTPSSGNQGATIASLAIVGSSTNFVNGTSVLTFTGTGITVIGLTVTSSTTATGNITIAGGATLGARDVTVTTGAEVASLTAGFTVTAPVTGVSTRINGNVKFTTGVQIH